MHSHRAIKAKSVTRGWSTCVTPSQCAANPQRQDAHGNLVYVDVCSCGATRETESNGRRTNFGEWKGGK